MTIQTKFNVGDEAFFMEDNKVVVSTVTGITIYVAEEGTFCTPVVRTFYSLVRYSSVEDKILFTTKQELLESL